MPPTLKGFRKIHRRLWETIMADSIETRPEVGQPATTSPVARASCSFPSPLKAKLLPNTTEPAQSQTAYSPKARLLITTLPSPGAVPPMRRPRAYESIRPLPPLAEMVFADTVVPAELPST